MFLQNRNFGDAIAVPNVKEFIYEILFSVPPRTKILAPPLLSPPPPQYQGPGNPMEITNDYLVHNKKRIFTIPPFNGHICYSTLLLHHSWQSSSYISLVCGSIQYIFSQYAVFVVRRTQRDNYLQPLLHWYRVQSYDFNYANLIRRIFQSFYSSSARVNIA